MWTLLYLLVAFFTLLLARTPKPGRRLLCALFWPVYWYMQAAYLIETLENRLENREGVRTFETAGD